MWQNHIENSHPFYTIRRKVWWDRFCKFFANNGSVTIHTMGSPILSQFVFLGAFLLENLLRNITLHCIIVQAYSGTICRAEKMMLWKSMWQRVPFYILFWVAKCNQFLQMLKIFTWFTWATAESSEKLIKIFRHLLFEMDNIFFAIFFSFFENMKSGQIAVFHEFFTFSKLYACLGMNANIFCWKNVIWNKSVLKSILVRLNVLKHI